MFLTPSANLDHFKDEMMILVPTDSSLRRVIPELKDTIPDPLMNDLRLQQYILSNHIIIHEGTVPTELLASLPEYLEVIKINMAGVNVVLHRENLDESGESVYKANGQVLSEEHSDGDSAIYQVDAMLFPNVKLIENAINRMAAKVGEEEPFGLTTPDQVTCLYHSFLYQ